ncbi:hypothetical protein [Shouchella miscanthi]|uniref:hypothetical protein n=1 Tax=Shouchella miscanthi TaxID=2598861 RepID=UPI0011A1A800|nr:hypothetical protein [Shouchella miscanthi]
MKKKKIPDLNVIIELEAERMKQDREFAQWLHTILPKIKNKTITEGETVAVTQALEARYMKYHAK